MGGPPPPPPVIPIDSVDEAKSSVASAAAALDTTMERIASLSSEEQHERVNGEWSALESLRHLVFVVDVWLSKTINGETDPFHPMGIPPHFVPRKPPGSSIDPDAQPTFEEVCDVLRGRLGMLERYIDALTVEELTRTIEAHAKTVGGGLSVIFKELGAHNHFINRDLDSLWRVRG